MHKNFISTSNVFCKKRNFTLILGRERSYRSVSSLAQELQVCSPFLSKEFPKVQQLPKIRWQTVENRRKFLDEIAIKLSIKNASDWGKVTPKQISVLGGSRILGFYNNSVYDCLQNVYDEIKWNREWFPSLPRSYWQSMENCRKFLDDVAIKLNIKNSSDWGKVTFKQIREVGGAGLLKYYNNSLFDCLKSVFGEQYWDRGWFSQLPQVPKSYWQSMENRKKFLDEVAIKLNIKNSSDWGNVTKKQIHDLGGAGLLNYYNQSLFESLQSVYKEIKWEREWFLQVPRVPKTNWNSIESRRKFFDQVEIKLNIKNSSDWRRVTKKQIRELGGVGILKYFKRSELNGLYTTYKELKWEKERYRKHPRLYWQSMENRRKFLDEVAIKLNIKNSSDWGKITIKQIQELGGTGLLKYYKDSLFNCLKSVFKETKWKRQWFLNLPRFSRAHWNSLQNCKKFMNEIAMHSNVISERDWRKVSVTLIRNNGGQGLLHRYNGSLQSILKSIYALESKERKTLVSTESLLEKSLRNLFPEPTLTWHPIT